MKIKYIFLVLLTAFLSTIITVKAETIECYNNVLLIDGVENKLAGINYETLTQDFCSYIDSEADILIEQEKILLYKDGESINKKIIADGLAKVSKTSNITINKELCTSEYEAMKDKIGIWSNNYTDTECSENDYIKDNTVKIITSDNSAYKEKWGLSEGISFKQILAYIFVGAVGLFIIVFKFKSIGTKIKRHK